MAGEAGKDRRKRSCSQREEESVVGQAGDVQWWIAGLESWASMSC